MGTDLSKGSFRPLATITSCPIDAKSSSWMLQPAVAQGHAHHHMIPATPCIGDADHAAIGSRTHL